MKIFLILIFALFSFQCLSAPYQRLFQDAKLPTQVMVEKQTLTNPAASGVKDILDDTAGGTGTGAASTATFIAQPDTARNLVITPGGTTANVAACVVVVSGTNFHGAAITENFTFASTQSTAETGAKAFKAVSGVTFPANCESTPFDATWSLGYGEKLGFKRCLDSAGHYVFSTVAGAYESTRGTVVADNNELEKNTIDFNGTMNGVNDFEVFFLQNFNSASGNCFP